MKYIYFHIIKYNSSLKASSLANAVFLCVIISAFCGCFVMVSHFQNVLNDKLFLQETLLSKNESALNYFLHNSTSLNYNKPSTINLFDDGSTSLLKKKHWGFYDVLVCKTFFKNDTISKTALVGKVKNNPDKLALYVTDYDKSLKLSGHTKIRGNLKIPNGKYEQAYINGKEGNTITVIGNQSKSSDRLPKLQKNSTINIDDFPNENVDTKDYKPLINSFSNPTKVIDVSSSYLPNGTTCKGNYILFSKNELNIDASLHLTDIIVVAPKVMINSGFIGNIQIIAEQEVIVEEKAQLLYPSSIYIKNDIDSVAVTVQKGSKVAGGIVIDGNTQTGALHRKLSIEKDATIIGDVYCYGKTELKGNIIGALYTDRLFLETNASKHQNVILNSSIDVEALPKQFIGLPLFNNHLNPNRYAVIKQL